MAAETPTSQTSSGKDKKHRSRSSRDGKHRSSRSSRDGKHRSSRESGDGKHKSSRESGSGNGRPTSSSRQSSSRQPSKPKPPTIQGDGTRGGEVAKKCAYLRYYILYTSGGWLGNLSMSLSDITGLWEITFLSMIFICSWTILRIGQVEITLILGHIYDLIIPLQHQFDPTKQKAHSNHLEQYWPIFLIGTIIEFGSFFLVHPDLFTLVACLKTLVLLILWLGRDSQGRFLTEKFGGKPNNNKSNDNRNRGDGDRNRGDGEGRPKKDDGKSNNNEDDGEPKKTRDDGSTKPKKDNKDNSDSDKKEKKKDDDGSNENKNKNKNLYDSKGFDGNLMPIRKTKPEKPKQRRRSS